MLSKDIPRGTVVGSCGSQKKADLSISLNKTETIKCKLKVKHWKCSILPPSPLGEVTFTKDEINTNITYDTNSGKSETYYRS